MWLRIACASAFLAPLGWLLGSMLPTWLLNVTLRAPRRIPWLWGINGAASVLGSVLATLVAIHAGISGCLWMGVGAYAAAGLLASRGEAVGVTSPGERGRESHG